MIQCEIAIMMECDNDGMLKFGTMTEKEIFIEKEFFSKICIVAEEADESEYWLEVIQDANLSNDDNQLK